MPCCSRRGQGKDASVYWIDMGLVNGFLVRCQSVTVKTPSVGFKVGRVFLVFAVEYH